MKTTFDLLKNGKNATSVFANEKTKEIYPAHRNSFGYNAEQKDDDFYQKYGKKLKLSQGKSDYRKFYYSEKQMNSIGFFLLERGKMPLWN